jgi:rhamnose transport system ATP-binding protein
MPPESAVAGPRRIDASSGDLAVSGVSKRFGGVPALVDVSVDVLRGTVHALIGENGAGKSTLGKIIAGVLEPDEGSINLAGDRVNLRSPRHALHLGIVSIAQELAIVPGLTVAENVFLGARVSWAGVVRRRALRRRFRELAEQTGFGLPPNVLAGGLSVADQQKVEIMRALSRNASIIVMDEPTAALSGPESAALHHVIRSLRARGTTVILVSHFLAEVLALSDTITTLRDGRVVSTVSAQGATEESLIEGMLGRSLDSAFPDKQLAPRDAEVILDIEGLRAPGVKGCSLQLRRGEILGIAGLVGSGRSELARAIARDVRAAAGTVSLVGSTFNAKSPHAAIRRGVVMIPESRKEQGLLMSRSVRDNVSLARLGVVSTFGWVLRGRERRIVDTLLRRTQVKGAGMEQPVMMLSGGNQQKLLFARAMMCEPTVLIADEPTRGVDVGARRAIYDLLLEMAADGVGIIMISSELEEILGVAHRVLVMRGGEFSAELEGERMTEEEILAAAFDQAVVSQGSARP